MPEVVVATGNKPWDSVFPIWKNDDENTEWRCINEILEAIAMNNRFGSKTPEELKEHLHKIQHDYFKEELAKVEGEPHNHKEEGMVGHTEFGCTVDEVIPEERLAIIEKRKKLFISYGKWMYYIDEVFANLAGAYREYKNA